MNPTLLRPRFVGWRGNPFYNITQGAFRIPVASSNWCAVVSDLDGFPMDAPSLSSLELNRDYRPPWLEGIYCLRQSTTPGRVVEWIARRSEACGK